MDWTALRLSLELSGWTALLLLPLGMLIARELAWRPLRGRAWLEALVALPLVLPPTVLGYYLLSAFGGTTWLGSAYQELIGRPLAFSFQGLVLASIIFNLPFAVQPMQRAFEAIPREVREAAWVSGLSPLRAFWRIELPLAWPGIISAMVLTVAHTVGEFGVVLMMGGNIPGETRTISIAIYDRVQAFDDQAAAAMSALLLAFSLVAIAVVYVITGRRARV
ncbi:MAG: molybdate ABC transporter permease subunit [Betaproteobacteria bacterium]|nr:molybdate ABC transporter permease subunit [Betaproteobacteria bacterium]